MSVLEVIIRISLAEAEANAFCQHTYHGHCGGGQKSFKGI
ncbi:protein of unknown function [Xenorhabdus poinarii G6]|uniref:Uncharacterized protein n=1 Tax=Xenorhabdus poinarii G6 TaxID=1354304 RepID=A0A068R6T4_9GAMM|nr:protein of unknown function [Xenorhabdus poinarii G6]